MAAPLPVVVEDRRLAVLVAHVATMMLALLNAQRRGQAMVGKAEAVRGQTTINQKMAAKMFKILLGLCNILNITKENSGRNSDRNRGSSCGGRSRGQWFAAMSTVAMVWCKPGWPKNL